jgi:hypothetical protein
VIFQTSLLKPQESQVFENDPGMKPRCRSLLGRNWCTTMALSGGKIGPNSNAAMWERILETGGSVHLFAFPPRQIRSHHKPKGLHWRTAPQFLTHVTLAEVMQVLRNEWMRAFVVCSCFGSRWGHPKAQRKSCSKVCLL